MEKVNFSFYGGKYCLLKRKLAEHLEKVGKGEIVIPEAEKPAVQASDKVVAEADTLGISLDDVEGTGKDGRVLRKDLQEYQTRMLKAD